jgi:hypothetical protein
VSGAATFLDAEGRTITVGAAVDGGGTLPDGTVERLIPEGDEEGGTPEVEVRWPEGLERFGTRPRDSRREGPFFESIEAWVCDDIEVRGG